MQEITLTGKTRTEIGKKYAKQMRKEGFIPCNLYGEAKGADGKPVAVSFAIPVNELRKAIFTPVIYLCNLNIDGSEHKAVITEIQQHPVTDALLHVDFYEVNETKPITIGIPVKTSGHAVGVRDGGKLTLAIRKIKVTAPYKQIPEVLTIDVTKLGLGKSIKVAELSFEGLEIATPAEVVVCSVKMTRQARSAAESAEEAGAAE